MSCDRRTFLHATGAGMAALSLPRGLMARQQSDRIDRIGLQLYTVRDAMQADFDGTLARVAAVGYRDVEFAGYFGRSAAQVRASLARAGLAAPSAHVGLDVLGDAWKRTLDDAHAIGHRYLVVAWIDEKDRKDLDAYRRVADRFNRAAEEAAAAGIRFAYHNHSFEFARFDGKLAYDVLLAATDPARVLLEMDLYWLVQGGQDPLAYFARWPGRIRMVHVKDSAGPPEHRMVDVGAGVIDWRTIFAHRAQAGFEHCFVEHDQPADPFASIAASYAYLRRLRF